MSKQPLVSVLFAFTLLGPLATAKYIGPDSPKGCSTCGSVHAPTPK